MLPKENRLSREGVKDVMRRGQRADSANVSARYVLLSVGEPQVGVTISKKVSPQATKRNALRRKVYQACRFFMEEQELRADVQFILKPSSGKIGEEELQSEVRSLLSKIGSRS